MLNCLETLRRALSAAVVLVLVSAGTRVAEAQIAPLPVGGAHAATRANTRARVDTMCDTVKTKATAAKARFIVAPYGWMSGISGSTSVRDLSADIDVKFIDLLKHLKFAAMGTFEVQYGPALFITDNIYSSVKVDHTLARIRTQPNLDLTSKTFISQSFVGYSFTATPTVAVDVLAGARLWSLRSTLNVSGDLVSRERSSTSTWADALGGLRVRWAPAPSWQVSVAGDGGAGGSKGTGEGIATVGYDLGRYWSLFAAYRYLQVNYSKNDYALDIHMDGPVIGGAYRW